MSYIYDNPNPYGKKVGDCVVRALSRALGMSWDEVGRDEFNQLATSVAAMSQNLEKLIKDLGGSNNE